ncbi:MAG: riboflavin synthase [Halanaerobiaceae bacterium]
MFTGIVKEIGEMQRRIRRQNKYQLVIGADEMMKILSQGDSIAVNGACLTAVAFSETAFTADVMPETLKNTNLGDMSPGDKLNLEPALQPNDFLGGHLMTGHVDGTGQVESIDREGNALLVEISLVPELLRYLVDRGSVGVNGVSLTVMDITEGQIKISLIPETCNTTNLGTLSEGDTVNIETDLIGKYVYKILTSGNEKEGDGDSGISKELLRENGFI